MTTAIRLDVERDANDALVARFTYAPGYMDAVAVQERDLNSDSDFADTNEVVYYHTNTLFSVYGLTDAGGWVVERYRFDSYGAPTVLNPDGSVDEDGLSDIRNPYLYTGRTMDSESGLMYYRNRYYSPALGRFVSREMLQPPRPTNLYAYAGGNPLNAVDPTGLFVEKVYDFAVGAGATGLRWLRDHPKICALLCAGVCRLTVAPKVAGYCIVVTGELLGPFAVPVCAVVAASTCVVTCGEICQGGWVPWHLLRPPEGPPRVFPPEKSCSERLMDSWNTAEAHGWPTPPASAKLDAIRACQEGEAKRKAAERAASGGRSGGYHWPGP